MCPFGIKAVVTGCKKRCTNLGTQELLFARRSNDITLTSLRRVSSRIF